MKKSRLVCLAVFLIAAVLCLTGCENKKAQYEKAQGLIEEARYEEAAKLLEKLKDYEDSSSLAVYCKALQAGESGRFDDAVTLFSGLGDYRDAERMTVYFRARKIEDSIGGNGAADTDKWFEAIDMYESAASFRDSGERAERCRKQVYEYAVSSGNEGNTEEAVSVFARLGAYNDSEKQLIYYKAAALLAEEKYKEASEMFGSLAGFRDANAQAAGAMGEGYRKAQTLITQNKYEEAARLLDTLENYEDSSRLSMYCKAIIAGENGEYDTAVSSFTALGDFRDSSLMITYYTARKTEASVYKDDSIDGQYWFDAIEIYESIPLFRDSGERAEACRKDAYTRAVENGDEENYEFAVRILKQLGDYSDARKQAAYYEAKSLRREGYYREAADMYSCLPGFRDADAQAEKALKDGYDAAADLEKQGKWERAKKAFLSLGEYRDAATRAYRLCYETGLRLRESGKWDEARNAFREAEGYSDAQTQIKETTYLEASALERAGDQEGAYRLFTRLGDYSNAFERANKPYYDLGNEMRQAGEWDAAAAAFRHAGTYLDAEEQFFITWYEAGNQKREAQDWGGARTAFGRAGSYSDAKEQISATWYAEGEAKREAQDWDGARTAFERAGEYSDARDQISETTYREAAALEQAGDQEGAYTLFISLGDYTNAYERANKPYYDLGAAKREAGEWDAAVAAFEHAGTYLDAADQISLTRYMEGEAKRKARDWDGAVAAFELAGDYRDAKIQIQATRYAEAESRREAQDWNGAVKLFIQLGDYGDAKDQIKATRYAEAESRREAQDWEGALKEFGDLGDYSDAAEQVRETRYQQADAYEKQGNQQAAKELFIGLGDYRDSVERAYKPYYDLGIAKREAGEWDAAVEAFEQAGSYHDAAEQIRATRYSEGEAKRAVQDWDGAVAAFGRAGQYSDAAAQIKETRYQQAALLNEQGHYVKAYLIYRQIADYKDSGDILRGNEIYVLLDAEYPTRIAAFRDKGGIVTLGAYPQGRDGTDSKEIEWIVADVHEDKVLLVSRTALDAQPYGITGVDHCAWEDSLLCAWLNDSFMNRAFSPEEQEALLPFDDHQQHNAAKGGQPAEIRVSLLSRDEYVSLLFRADQLLFSSYAAHAFGNTDETKWWLRSDAVDGMAEILNKKRSQSHGPVEAVNLVRPAVWLDLEADYWTERIRTDIEKEKRQKEEQEAEEERARMRAEKKKQEKKVSTSDFMKIRGNDVELLGCVTLGMKIGDIVTILDDEGYHFYNDNDREKEMEAGDTAVKIGYFEIKLTMDDYPVSYGTFQILSELGKGKGTEEKTISAKFWIHSENGKPLTIYNTVEKNLTEGYGDALYTNKNKKVWEPSRKTLPHPKVYSESHKISYFYGCDPKYRPDYYSQRIFELGDGSMVLLEHVLPEANGFFNNNMIVVTIYNPEVLK